MRFRPILLVEDTNGKVKAGVTVEHDLGCEGEANERINDYNRPQTVREREIAEGENETGR